jgi:hypothetical protein
LRRKAKHAVAAVGHLRPHVVEEVGEKRQSTGVPGRFLGGAPGYVAGKMLGLEAGGEQLGRPAHSLKQLRLPQRLYLDLSRYVIERLVFL